VLRTAKLSSEVNLRKRMCSSKYVCMSNQMDTFVVRPALRISGPGSMVRYPCRVPRRPPLRGGTPRNHFFLSVGFLLIDKEGVQITYAMNVQLYLYGTGSFQFPANSVQLQLHCSTYSQSSELVVVSLS
jgi:hypothetical protein